MKTKNLFSKVVAGVLSVLMLVGMIPNFASAAEGENADGLYLDKKVTIAGDGTYTIQLEAYATGIITTKVERTTKPTDIILVLDQSGSMADPMSGLPNDTYTQAEAMTNAQAYEKSLYYLVDGAYYPVTVKYASTDELLYYVDVAGNIYTSGVATSWTDYYGHTHNSETPYIESSITKFYRTESGSLVKSYKYLTEAGETVADASNMASARNEVRTAYSTYTVQFINDATNGYTAAAYTSVAPVYQHSYEYYYTKDGEMHLLPQFGTANDAACPYTFYERGVQSNTSRLEVLHYSAKEFVDKVYAEVTDTADHRIAVVSFGGSAVNRSNGLLSVSSNLDALKTAIEEVPADGATGADYGMQMAQDILDARTADEKANRDAIVVFFTDGEPNHQSGFDEAVAADAINISKELKMGYDVTDAEADGGGGNEIANTSKGYKATVFSVAVYDDANPSGSANILGSGATQINDFMHMMSSNYPEARGEKQAGVLGLGTRPWEFFRGSGSMMSGYYMVADNAASLSRVFTTIVESMTTTTASIQLDAESVLRDVISDDFILPDDFSVEQNVTVETSAYQGNGNWAAPVAFTDAVVTRDGNTIDVTNFDYTAEGNLVILSGNQGKKIIVTITGVEAKDSAVTGELVDTNTSDSGIWDNADGDQLVQVDRFEIPSVTINKKTFVLDYAKETNLDVSDVIGTLLGIDDASDMTMNNIDEALASIVETYGELKVKTDGNGKYLSYLPKAMQWNGYDNFYAFGKLAENSYAWSKLSVLPANNVYFEDSFVSSTQTGTAGITYTGTWTEVGEAANNTGTANGPAHGGWIEGDEGLSNDTGYSDGTAHTSSSAGAKATFSFTGTGFDIYCRTNGKTGTVLLQVKDTKTGASKFLAVDCQAQSGDYYQIPALWFSGEYSTYEVTITVTSAAGDRLEYYLDGIKIYNPMNTMDTTDETVQDAYGAELNAVFQSVRDILIPNPEVEVPEGETLEGAVLIDSFWEGNGAPTNKLSVYQDYGPKNEVYIGKGQMLTFNVGAATNIQIGLKAPAGETIAYVSSLNDAGEHVQGEILINHSTDLFYPVTPDENGNVAIKNDGEGILSVTKIKFCGNDADAEIAALTVDEVLFAAETFNAMPVAAYSLRASAPAAPVEPETPAEPEQPAEPETPVEPSKPDVEIEQPVEPERPSIEAAQEQIKQFVTKLFNAFRGWLGRK